MEKLVTLTVERLREYLDYDPETGIFTRKESNLARWKIGDEAGHLHSQGYVHIWIDGVIHKAHRLAWMHHYGEMPPREIDHIDRNRSNNRICNLRAATRGQNTANSVSRSKSGFKGVYARKNLWQAQIRMGGKTHSLGYFRTAEAASDAFRSKHHEVYGAFSRH